MYQIEEEVPVAGLLGLKKTLTRVLGKGRVKDTALDRDMYSYDSSPFTALPDLVVFPETTGETSEIIKAAACFQVPVMPRGAGTCLSGGAVPVRGGVSLGMTRMNRILGIDLFSRTALVEPGVVNLDLQEALDPLGLMFPPDPASQKVATIGGNVAECAGGIQGARYGVTKNYVLGLELVLADGQVVTTGLLSKDETLGPDFTGIFNGSEGAFAVVTKILVSLRPRPESFRTALAVFTDLNQAALAVSGIIGQGIIPTALELMDQTMLRAVDDYAGIGFPQDAEAVLLMEVDGYTVDLDRQLDLMVQVCRDNGARTVDKAANASEREALWKARRSGNGALGRIRPAYTVHDVTVPRNQVAPLLTRIRDIGTQFGMIIAQMAHAGDGNAHPHLLYYPDEEGIKQRIHDVTEQIFQAALDLGGTISGEHGIGLEKMPFMGMQFSGADLSFMARVKACLDPDQQLNPGKVLPPSRGGKNGRSGGQVPGIQKDLSAQILKFIPENMTIEVSADTPLNRVQEAAAAINAWLPLDAETQGKMTMAELVAQGACGREAMAWGSLKEYIFGMEFTTLSGDRVRTGGHTAKNVAGFDFTRLLWKSGKRLGRIDSITLKLMPLPESRGLVTRDFATLSDCLAAARQVLNGNLALATLMAENHGEGPWTLAAGLAGSDILVSSHTRKLSGLMQAPKGAGDTTVWPRDEIPSFWQGWAGRSRACSKPAALGRGVRRPMFDFLEQQAHVLEDTGFRVELDFGYPGMRVLQAGTEGDGFPGLGGGILSAEDSRTGAGFHLRAADTFTAGPLYERLYPVLTGKPAAGGVLP